MADRWYFSVVEPTTQTRAGGSASSSRYIVYADVPGGVVNCQGSCAVPVPAMSRSVLLDAGSPPRRRCYSRAPGAATSPADRLVRKATFNPVP